MKLSHHALPAIAAVLLLSGTAHAASIYDQYFGKANHGAPCYARSYDKAHLKKHPKQTVQQIQISYDVTQGDTDKPNSAAYFEIGFSFMLKGSQDWNGGAAYCKTAKGFFDCYLDADGGLIHLTPQGTALRLDVLNRGGTDKRKNQIQVEGNDSAVGFGTPDGDDLTFVLPKADRAVCDADSGY